jgi:hypothetical protein
VLTEQPIYIMSRQSSSSKHNKLETDYWPV